MNTADVDAFTVTLTVCSSCDQPKHDQVESVQVGKFYFDLSSFPRHLIGKIATSQTLILQALSYIFFVYKR